MKQVFLVAVLALFAVTEAAKFTQLRKDNPVTYCTSTQLIMCVSEIETAWNDCSSAADIFTCIEDILGATDCWTCVCDVLGIC